jgi:hypothetical protein
LNLAERTSAQSNKVHREDAEKAKRFRRRWDSGTIDLQRIMEIIAILIRILEVLFVVGLLGSGVVILFSGLEDIETALEPDEPVAS